MKKIYNIKILLLHILLLIAISKISIAEETIPIPPIRPDVMNVSPAYIKELKNRGKQQSLLTLPFTGENEREDQGDNQDEELDVSSDKKTVTAKNIVPVPTHKPLFNNIEPSSRSNNNSDIEQNETTLISFSLMPEQIALDENLEIFLKTRAIKLFNENKNLKMEIHAYAAAIKGEPHSDARISLARALKVRSFLINNDVAPNRLKLSTVGEKNSDSNPDRIDLIFIDTSK